ncbi:hypothetical protein VFPPC_17988 [Pochonia chlamydosporia 170]|uniref:Uncharacterized protein n=1 Tax=Pochonia chlamydosporia 170 TaxID=1380566 RepID=A0A219AQC0_METCM|nr:hypothetical protein VFPPC_17988 [Pochonia chlamydosporia 170]OWT42819.1 hypothetical protein VFPPC_17988 [Pochonia chlamydosporia 170]
MRVEWPKIEASATSPLSTATTPLCLCRDRVHEASRGMLWSCQNTTWRRMTLVGKPLASRGMTSSTLVQRSSVSTVSRASAVIDIFAPSLVSLCPLHFK